MTKSLVPYVDATTIMLEGGHSVVLEMLQYQFCAKPTSCALQKQEDSWTVVLLFLHMQWSGYYQTFVSILVLFCSVFIHYGEISSFSNYLSVCLSDFGFTQCFFSFQILIFFNAFFKNQRHKMFEDKNTFYARILINWVRDSKLLFMCDMKIAVRWTATSEKPAQFHLKFKADGPAFPTHMLSARRVFPRAWKNKSIEF